MDKCQFSEFSFGYCVTEDLIVGQGMQLIAAPIFPSLIEEGQPGVGYDVRLDRPGTPLFLQFKLVHQMVRGNAYEAQCGHFQPPFYRMHLRPRAISDQHESLLSLEAAGNDVFYVAPGFHTTGALNTAYSNRLVWNRSFKIRPSMIGPLPDDDPHHVTFTTPEGNCRRYSEGPSEERKAAQTREIEETLHRRITERGGKTLQEQVRGLDESMVAIVTARNTNRREGERINLRELGAEVDPTRRAAYLARQFFDCQLLFVTSK